MSNRRPILFFVVGIALVGGLLMWLEMRARQAWTGISIFRRGM